MSYGDALKLTVHERELILGWIKEELEKKSQDLAEMSKKTKKRLK